MEDTIEGLLNLPQFVQYAKLEVPANKLRNMFAIDMSLRSVQRAASEARNNPLPELEDVVAQICAEYELADNRPATVPEWTKIIEPVTTKTFKVPTLRLPDATSWFKLEGDYALLSDVHIPFYHAPTLERLMSDSDKVDVRQLVIMGDLFDFNAFNHSRGANYQRKAQDDVEAGRLVLKALLQCYEKIYVFMGNHDEWLTKHLKMHFDSNFLFASFFKEMPQIKWSNYGQADVLSGGVKWKLIHGTSFSGANPLGSTKSYCTKYSCNVVTGHQHRAEEGYSPGGYKAILLGGAYDDTKMGYLHHQPFGSGISKRSVGILKEGHVAHIQDV